MNFSEIFTRKNIEVDVNGYAKTAGKGKILIQILEDINKELFNNNAAIHVNIQTNYVDQPYSDIFLKYTLGIETFDFNRHFSTIDPPLERLAIHLTSLIDEFDISTCVKLIYYGLNHHSEIEQWQSDVYSFNGINVHIPTLKGIRPETLDRILQLKFPELDTFFNRRYYSSETSLLGSFQYYYQHNSFHFFSLKNEMEFNANWIYLHQTSTIPPIIDTTYLVSSCLYWIFASKPVFLIFTEPNSFYSLNLANKNIKGPFAIPYNFRDLSIDSYPIPEPNDPSGDTVVLHYSAFVTVKFYHMVGRLDLETNFFKSEQEQKFAADTTKFIFQNNQPKINAYAERTNPRIFLAGVCLTLFIIITVIAQHKISIRL